MKQAGRIAGRYAFAGFIWLFRVLPIDVGLWVGRRLGAAFRTVAKSRYRRAIENIDLAYGDTIPDEQKRKIAHDCFEHFGMMLVESIKFGALTNEEVQRRIEVQGYPIYKELLDRGKGVLFITGHLGNFELPGRLYTGWGNKLMAIARENRDPGTTAMMMKVRADLGIEVISIKNALRPMYQRLKEGGCVAIIADQNASDLFVPFFGVDTGTVDGPARIALRTGAPLLYYSCTRKRPGFYTAKVFGFSDPISTGDSDADVRRLMTEANATLEQMIREAPEQWLWFHDRWKASRQKGLLPGHSNPPGASSI